MDAIRPRRLAACVLAALVSVLLAQGAGAQGDVIGFGSSLWVKRNADVVKYMGRESLVGFAYLDGVEFTNGVVEVDVAMFPPGNIDGIRVDERGHYLVSHWEGRVYRVAPTGDIERILDTTVSGANCADFEYVKDERLLVAPTFGDDRLVAYRLAD